jgi:hypothetical protein
MTTIEENRGHTDRRRAGAESAERVFDRLFEKVEEPRPASSPPDGDSDDAEANLRGIRAAAATAIDTYADLLQRTFELYADLAESTVRRGGRAASGGEGQPVQLTGAPGDRIETTVWAHNATDAPAVGVALCLTTLTAHDGAVINAAAGCFEPRRTTVEPGASASSWLTVTIPPGTAEGVYFGYVLATGLPEANTPVRVVVTG